jgi:hypothetical protein
MLLLKLLQLQQVVLFYITIELDHLLAVEVMKIKIKNKKNENKPNQGNKGTK